MLDLVTFLVALLFMILLQLRIVWLVRIAYRRAGKEEAGFFKDVYSSLSQKFLMKHLFPLPLKDDQTGLVEPHNKVIAGLYVTFIVMAVLFALQLRGLG